MPASITLVTGVLVCASILIALFAPKWLALSAAVMASFVPIARVELALFGGSIGVRPEDILIAILAVRTFWSRAMGSPDNRRSSFFKWYGVLVALCAASFLWSMVDWASGHAGSDAPALYVAQRMIGSTALIWITWEICRTPRTLKWVMGGAIAGGVIMFALIFFGGGGAPGQTVSQSDVYYSEMYNAKFRNVERLASWNPNVVGLSCGMLLILTAGVLAAGPRFWRRLLLLGACGIFAFGLARSYTRTAMIAAAAAGVYVVFRLVAFGYLKRTVVGLAFLGLCIAGIVAYSVDSNAFRLDLGADVNTGSRMAVWGAGLELLTDYPLGFGVGRAEQALAQRVLFDSAHNDWLDFGLSIGILGALYALFTFSRLFAEARAATRRAPAKAPFIVAESLLVYFFIASMALQVYTFQKQVFVGIAMLLAFLHMRNSGSERHAAIRLEFRTAAPRTARLPHLAIK
jgi:O-antigen ligase/polysaccharide polymerase Wzy-like membrane protein